MGRALLILNGPVERQKAVHWIGKAPPGTRVEFKASKRTLPQNDLMWAILTEIAEHQKKHHGRDYATDEWKLIFLHAWGREVRFLPALDGKGAVPIPQSSSDLSKDEMTDFIEFLFAWGAENGVTFKAQNSDDGVPSQSSDEAGNSSQAPADQDGDGDSSSSLPSEGEPEPTSAAERAVLIRFAKDVLHKAADPKISGETLMKVEKTWAADIAGLSDQAKTKAKAISSSMRAIVKGDADLNAAVSYFEEVLDCPGQIGGGHG